MLGLVHVLQLQGHVAAQPHYHCTGALRLSLPVALVCDDAALVWQSADLSSCGQHLNASLVLASSGVGHTA